MEVTTRSTGETKELAERIAKKLKPGNVLALYGELGSGKTTFTNFLVAALGIQARVQSPTFVIARKYIGTGKNTINVVNHVDLYRLTSADEVKDVGLNELLLDDEAITVIEWPEHAEKILPEKCVKIKFEYTGDDSRKIYVQNLY